MISLCKCKKHLRLKRSFNMKGNSAFGSPLIKSARVVVVMMLFFYQISDFSLNLRNSGRKKITFPFVGGKNALPMTLACVKVELLSLEEMATCHAVENSLCLY